MLLVSRGLGLGRGTNQPCENGLMFSSRAFNAGHRPAHHQVGGARPTGWALDRRSELRRLHMHRVMPSITATAIKQALVPVATRAPLSSNLQIIRERLQCSMRADAKVGSVFGIRHRNQHHVFHHTTLVRVLGRMEQIVQLVGVL